MFPRSRESNAVSGDNELVATESLNATKDAPKSAVASTSMNYGSRSMPRSLTFHPGLATVLIITYWPALSLTLVRGSG